MDADGTVRDDIALTSISVEKFDYRMSMIMQRGTSSLNVAAARGQLEAIKILGAGAPLKVLNEGLGWAAFAGQLKAVQMIVHNGANVDAMKMFNSSSTHFEPISVSDDVPIVETVTARTQSIGMTTGTMTSQRKAMNVNNKKLVNPLGGSSLRMMR